MEILCHYMSGQLVLKHAMCVLALLLVVEETAYGHPIIGSEGWDNSPSELTNGERALFHLENGNTRKKRSVDHYSRIVKRSVAMDNTQSTYQSFYNQLAPFVEDLKQKLKGDAPADLEHLDVVTKIFSPNNDAFGQGNVEVVIKRIMLTFDVTKLILEKVGPFVEDDQQSWLSGEKSKLDMYITFGTMSLANLRLEHSDIEVVSGGLGGINKGVYNGMNAEVLQQIISLSTVLKT